MWKCVHDTRVSARVGFVGLACSNLAVRYKMPFEYREPVLPKRGDKLFVHDRNNWEMDAILDPHRGDDYAYREGYRLAGRILTEAAAKGGGVDMLVYPICHAYRHCVELALKQLMFLGCRIVGRQMTPAEDKLYKNSHNLAQLLTSFQAIEAEVSAGLGDSYPKAEFDGVAAYIEQLHEVDAGSFSFRYPFTKNGEVSLGPLQRINLAQFSEKMERLCTLLEGMDLYYKKIVQWNAEMYSQYAADMYSDYDPSF
jgi:hypothetical protein